jgi:hypothetical protein
MVTSHNFGPLLKPVYLLDAVDWPYVSSPCATYQVVNFLSSSFCNKTSHKCDVLLMTFKTRRCALSLDQTINFTRQRVKFEMNAK